MYGIGEHIDLEHERFEPRQTLLTSSIVDTRDLLDRFSDPDLGPARIAYGPFGVIIDRVSIHVDGGHRVAATAHFVAVDMGQDCWYLYPIPHRVCICHIDAEGRISMLSE